MKVSAEPRSRVFIREIATKVRSQLNMLDVYKFPIIQVIELLAASEDDLFELEILPDNEMNDTYGVTNTNTNIMKISERVYDGAVQGNARDRFTICHELGHYLLHQPESINFARGVIPTYCDPEWQANVFAAELLIPYNLTKDFDIEDIVEKCGVSYQCASIQKNI